MGRSAEEGKKYNRVQVCFSPAMYEHFADDSSIVVVVDIFRATSAICAAFEHGVGAIIPVAKLEDALEYKKKGFLAGGERNGVVQEGFDFGNSPFSYMDPALKGKEIALTTTNGTQAIEAAKHAYCVVIGSFINLDALAAWLVKKDRDVVIFCAGWKNRFNMEDSLFAGALTNLLLESGNYKSDCDSANSSSLVYRTVKRNMMKFLATCSHRKRLAHLNLDEDVKFCLTPNQSTAIPVLKGDKLVADLHDQ